MKDKYDEAVEFLTDYPDEIQYAWEHVKENLYEGGALFLWCNPNKSSNQKPNFQPGKLCGCLTQIRQDPTTWAAFTPGLTKKIQEDSRIPTDATQITVDKLPLFAAWQRFMDRYFASGCDDTLLAEEVMP